MNLVNLEQAAKAYHERVLLDGVSLGITAGQRIGVVGRNGAGKTTLLAALAGTAHLDSGRTTRTRDITIGHLPQSEQLTGNVASVVFGGIAEHEWAADPRSRAVVEALLDLAELRADHGGGLADGALGGVESPGGVLDGVGGGPAAAVGELAELAVGDAVVVHGFLL